MDLLTSANKGKRGRHGIVSKLVTYPHQCSRVSSHQRHAAL